MNHPMNRTNPSGFHGVPVHTTAIVITTYKRNDMLLRLLDQLQGFIKNYVGPNRYYICVADSDLNNDVELPADVSYVKNAGKGFDENLIGAMLSQCGSADFIFAMADDDLFNPALNPLHVLDAVYHQDVDVVLFNHMSFVVRGGDLFVGNKHYGDRGIGLLYTDPMDQVGGMIPRYCGLLYRARFLVEIKKQMPDFVGTLHAYAAPVFMAVSRQRLRFVDYPIALFESSTKADGAWENSAHVLDGLFVFLDKIRGHLSDVNFRKFIFHFYRCYLTPGSGYFKEEVRAQQFPTYDSFEKSVLV